MQGISKMLPGKAVEADPAFYPKMIPAMPATQSEPILPAGRHDRGWPKLVQSDTDILYRELTGHDPKPVDRGQYNYGRCLPWKTQTKTPAEYLRTEYLHSAICKRLMQFSDAEWELSMALKAVRDADNETEFQAALAALPAARARDDLLGIDATYNQANMPAEPEDYVYGENI